MTSRSRKTPSPLEQRIRDRIAAEGSISLSSYMALCLADPEHGYYQRQDPLGVAGDFTTAPEISQIFGELIGLWIVQCWLDQGSPTPAALVELGPGRGTLMADALRAIAAAAPQGRDAFQVFLVETSPALRERQAETLAGAAPVWLDALADLPERPLFLIANEFFDALPIDRFSKCDDGSWRETRVMLADDHFAFAPSEDPVDLGGDPRIGREAADRVARLNLSAYEHCAEGRRIAAEIGRRLSHVGAALIVDYGYDRAMLTAGGGGDTLQAVRAHQFADPLADPGEADLTAHVDFDALATAATQNGETNAFGPVAQGSLLRRLGAEARAAALARKAPAKAEAIAAGLHRLTHPNEMGTLFQALTIAPSSAPIPPGFSE